MQPRRVESRPAMPHHLLTRQASSEAEMVLFFYHRGHRGTEENIYFVSVLCPQEKLFRS